MSIHVIGCNGFIGGALQREAYGLDLRLWSHRPKQKQMFIDILDRGSWKELVTSRPETVILLAWPGLPKYNEVFHISKNLPMCIELVEELDKSGVRKIVVAGTCYEYGLRNGAMREEMCTSPVNYYALAKDTLRKSIEMLAEKSNFNWAWLRIFYPYGEGQRESSLLQSLETAIERREKHFRMSSGRQIRDYVSVEVIAKQLLTLAVNGDAKGVYNGGSGQPVSIRELVEQRIIERASDIMLELGYYPDRSDEPLAFWADMSRMMKLNHCGDQE